MLRDIALLVQVLCIKLDIWLFRSPKSDWRRIRRASRS
jgi:hypothetical protein